MNSALTGRDILDSLAIGLTRLFSDSLESLLGAGVRNPVFGPVTWADLVATVCIGLLVSLTHGLAAVFLRRKTKEAVKAGSKVSQGHFVGALGKPLYVLIWIFGGYIAATPLLLKLMASERLQVVRGFVDKLFDLGMFAILLWLFFRFTHVLEARLAAWAAKTQSKFDDMFVALLGKSLRVIVPVVGIIFALPLLGLPAEYSGVLAKGSSILLIIAVAFILSQAVNLGGKAVLMKYDIAAPDNLHARKVQTQVLFISKTFYVLIGLFAVASVLMLFEEVRRFGTSILASAGVVGVILGFAAQKTISNLLAGLQLAMTQPIRLDDVVVVEGEWGRIEEISLTYVVLHIWDDRRLVLPLSYFIEKPFQNWTRVSAELLGSVFVWVDYSLPLEETRNAVKEIVESNPLWDRRFWNLQITDATERTMQIRVLATAADSSKSWDLRCAIREQLIGYIQKHHPQGLPQLRARLDNSKAGSPLKPMDASIEMGMDSRSAAHLADLRGPPSGVTQETVKAAPQKHNE
jgi:small-conductance mechanosensitive channel